MISHYSTFSVATEIISSRAPDRPPQYHALDGCHCGRWVLGCRMWPLDLASMFLATDHWRLLVLHLIHEFPCNSALGWLRHIQLNQGHTCSFHPFKSSKDAVSNQHPSFQKHPTVPNDTCFGVKFSPSFCFSSLRSLASSLCSFWLSLANKSAGSGKSHSSLYPCFCRVTCCQPLNDYVDYVILLNWRWLGEVLPARLSSINPSSSSHHLLSMSERSSDWRRLFNRTRCILLRRCHQHFCLMSIAEGRRQAKSLSST